jgi:DNA-binding HxlR family transcriptional regulator
VDKTAEAHSHCVLDPGCASRNVFEVVSGRWGPLVIMALKGETKRHGELRRELEGISQKMLIQTLRNLEHNGLVEREVYPVVPPKVEYSLTPLGRPYNSCSRPSANGLSGTSRRWRRRAWARARRRSGAAWDSSTLRRRQAWPRRRASVVEDRQGELAEACGFGDQVDLDDLPARYLEAEDDA